MNNSSDKLRVFVVSKYDHEVGERFESNNNEYFVGMYIKLHRSDAAIKS